MLAPTTRCDRRNGMAMRVPRIATRALGVIGQPLRVRIGMHSGPLVAGVLAPTR